MLKKAQRLSRTEFSHYFKTGQKSHTPYFSIIKASNTTFKGAVVVSKKLYKSAPARNRLRRQTYAQLANLAKLTASQSVSTSVPGATSQLVLIVIFNPKAKDIPRTKLMSLLKEKLDELR